MYIQNRDENELDAACACRILPIYPDRFSRAAGKKNTVSGTAPGTHADPEDRRALSGLRPSSRRGSALSAGMHGTVRNGRTGVRARAHFPSTRTRAREKKVARAVLTCRRARNGHKSARFTTDDHSRPAATGHGCAPAARGLITAAAAARERRRVMAAPRRLCSFYAEVDCCGAARPANRACL